MNIAVLLKVFAFDRNIEDVFFMKLSMLIPNKISLILFFGTCVYASQLMAGILEMPEITETPELKKKSMLRDLDIPGVKERSPDPSAGPRLAVSEFRIQGLVEYPELGITREALRKMVEEIRADLMDEDEYLPSGYTIDELGELSDLLVDIEDETQGRHVTPSEVQRLIWLVRAQRTKRGILLSQIESIADKITRFYRERGFILAKAYIPKQEVRDGIVNLTLLIGVLGEVQTHGNQLYSDKVISSVFDGMLAMPLTNSAVEESLYLINDFPGVTADGYFEPGAQVGDSKLNINIRDEDRYSANLRLDNHGTDETGLYRLYADFQVNNTLGFADLLKLSILNASRPNNTRYWRLNYQMNVFSPRLKIGAGISKNQFVVDQSSSLTSLNLNGIVNAKDVSVTYIFRRSRVKSYNLVLKYEDLESDLQVGDIPDVGGRLDERLENTSLQFNYDILRESSQLLHQGNVRLTSGTFVFGAGAERDKKYYILSAEYTSLMFWRVPYFDATTRLIFRTSAQYSGTNLSTIVRFSAAGLSRVRAFSPNIYSADDAVYAGVDWVFSSPDFMGANIQKMIKPFVFADYAYGKQQPIINEDAVTAKLSDVGFGLQFAHGVEFKGNIQFAFPLESNFSRPDIAPDEKEMRILFDIQYGF